MTLLQSNPSDVPSMTLTASERAQLNLLRTYRDSPPTVLGYFKVHWKSTVFICAVCAVAATFYYWGGWSILSGFFIGTVFGVLTRDAGWYRKLVRTWPLSREITDWRRVDELVERDL
jgi:hypothetical protein